jgi:hypothetical protein
VLGYAAALPLLAGYGSEGEWWCGGVVGCFSFPAGRGSGGKARARQRSLLGLSGLVQYLWPSDLSSSASSGSTVESVLWLQRRTRWSGPSSRSSSPVARFHLPDQTKWVQGTRSAASMLRRLLSRCAAPSGLVPRRWCGGRCTVTPSVAWWRPEGPDRVSHFDLGPFHTFTRSGCNFHFF